MNKKVLLIVPEFPPNNSIGGRRWAKFAKYLAKNNIVVKVIAFKPKRSKLTSNWMKDISDSNIEVFYLPSRYPELLETNSSNIFVRIIKKAFSLLVSLIDKGIIQDRAIFFRSTLLKKAHEIIEEHKILNVICS